VKVTTTPKASRDLDEWIGRIAENNPLAAEAFQNRIRQCIEVIRNHPEAGRRHPKRRTVRKLVEDPIVIYYEVFEDLKFFLCSCDNLVILKSLQHVDFRLSDSELILDSWLNAKIGESRFKKLKRPLLGILKSF